MRERKHPAEGHPPSRGLESHDAAKRGRYSARAAGVGSQRPIRHLLRDGDRRAGRGAAGDAPRLPIKRIAWRAIVRVQPESGVREFRHVGTPNGDEACRAQTRNGRAVRAGWRRATQDFRARCGDIACDVEQVLDRYRDARPRTDRHATRPKPVVIVRGGSRRLGMYLQKGTRPLARGIGDPDQTVLHQPAARGRAGLEVAGKLSERLHSSLHGGTAVLALHIPLPCMVTVARMVCHRDWRAVAFGG